MCVKRSANIIVYIPTLQYLYYVPIVAETYGYKTRNRYSLFVVFTILYEHKNENISKYITAVYSKSEKIVYTLLVEVHSNIVETK